MNNNNIVNFYKYDEPISKEFYNSLHNKYFKDWSRLWFKYILNNSEINWCFSFLSMNDNVSIDIIRENPHFNWDIPLFCRNKNVTPMLIENNPDISWNFLHLSFNKNINLEFINKNKDKPWNFNPLSDSDEIFVTDVISSPNYNWNYDILTINKNITLDIINSFPTVFWNRDAIGRNNNVTWEDILNPINTIPMNFEHICNNSNITPAIVEDNLGYPWIFQLLSKNKNFDLDYISNFPDRPWDIVLLSCNNSITWEDIMRKQENNNIANMLYTNMYLFMANNENFNWSVLEYGIENNLINKRSCLDICPRSFEKERVEYFIYRENQSIYINSIKEELNEVIWHPNNLEYALKLELEPEFQYELWGYL